MSSQPMLERKKKKETYLEINRDFVREGLTDGDRALRDARCSIVVGGLVEEDTMMVKRGAFGETIVGVHTYGVVGVDEQSGRRPVGPNSARLAPAIPEPRLTHHVPLTPTTLRSKRPSGFAVASETLYLQKRKRRPVSSSAIGRPGAHKHRASIINASCNLPDFMNSGCR